MSEKKYRLKKDIVSPFDLCKAGTESEYDGVYYCFKYEGKDKIGLGNSFMCMNPEDHSEWFELIADPKEWEVLRIEKKGAISFWSSGRGYTMEEILRDGWNIYSVKRLSDGEVFSIGDGFTTDKSSGNYKIVGFLIEKGGMMVDTGGCGCVFLKYINKKSVPEKEETKEQLLDKDKFDRFEVGLEELINKNSLENESHTPDYISAEFLTKVFEIFNKAIVDRTNWYAVPPEPPTQSKQPAPSSKERITVNIGTMNSGGGRGRPYQYDLVTSAPILAEDIPAIKEAIERCLNDEVSYSKMQVNMFMEDAFNVGKYGFPGPNGGTHCYHFKDYLDLLNSSR